MRNRELDEVQVEKTRNGHFFRKDQSMYPVYNSLNVSLSRTGRNQYLLKSVDSFDVKKHIMV